MCIRDRQERRIDTGICHICNSKAAIHAPDMHMDMVRVGAYIFGLASAPEQRLIPLREVLVWKARIVLLRDIAAGEGVGYGHAFIAKQPVRIAVLAAGFADGYRRCIAPVSYTHLQDNHQRGGSLVRIRKDQGLLEYLTGNTVNQYSGIFTERGSRKTWCLRLAVFLCMPVLHCGYGIENKRKRDRGIALYIDMQTAADLFANLC